MRRKKPHVATIDEVQISREGETAIIEFVDSSIATTHLSLGQATDSLSDHEILQCFNEVVQAQRKLASQYEHVAVEIPEGSPQVEYFEQTDQWCLRGDVLRCLVDDEDGQPVIVIDDQELTLEQFGKLLVTHAGWGMRLIVVPDDEISISPKIEIREP
ncbi:DUF7713 domain-containing protein [Roseiconus lacunae]|uniref:DUF7713 domain-containing protein n=1 Tax=Roseiconus lacunae TaxID=2605694 RepID=A0ABT7PP26_9BACT|nr:hypothetical protein [Roseiconus lacunae]MDM4018215.1 hypothetical protein [Roseiconus lacunae]